jgi:hypothetical protein
MTVTEYPLSYADLQRLGVFDGKAPNFDITKTHPVQFSDECRCNVSDEVILQQIAQNIRRGLPQARPHAPHPYPALLVCGGPSLASTQQELVDAPWRGGKIVAVNGAFQWCIDHNIRPSAVIMLGAREFNARFVAPNVPECNYLLAGQCHPAAFDLCKGRSVFIWHALTAGQAELDMLDAFYWKQHWPVSVGTTVGIRAISLLRMLGFDSMEIFGLDSCWLDGKHHGYAQKENDEEPAISVWLRPEGRDDLAKQFYCAPWMMKQAEDFQELIRERGNLFRLAVHGPGLIAEILKTGAELEPEPEGD